MNDAPPSLVRNVLQLPGAPTKIVYNLNNGAFVGAITIEMTQPAMLGAIAADFQAFIAEATKAIATVPAGALSQLDRARERGKHNGHG